MNKTELVGAVADRTKLPRKDVQAVVSAVLEVVISQIVKGHSVTLVGLGTFASRLAKARTARNPNTGEPLHLPKRMRPTFNPSETLKKNVALLPTGDADNG